MRDGARASKPIRPTDRAGAVVREAIEWISCKRAQIGDAVGHVGRGGRHGVVTIGVATPVPPCGVARVTGRALSRQMSIGGFRPRISPSAGMIHEQNQ
jgi:hypothetical protein